VIDAAEFFVKIGDVEEVAVHVTGDTTGFWSDRMDAMAHEDVVSGLGGRLVSPVVGLDVLEVGGEEFFDGAGFSGFILELGLEEDSQGSVLVGLALLGAGVVVEAGDEGFGFGLGWRGVVLHHPVTGEDASELLAVASVA